MGDGDLAALPAADGGRIEVETESALDLAGGGAVAGGRLRGEQRLDLGRPRRRVLTAGDAGRPAGGLATRTGAEVIGVEFVKAGAADAEFSRGGRGAQLIGAESGKDFADEGWSVAMGELLAVFFIARKVRERRPDGEGASAARRSVRFCSQCDTQAPNCQRKSSLFPQDTTLQRAVFLKIDAESLQCIPRPSAPRRVLSGGMRKIQNGAGCSNGKLRLRFYKAVAQSPSWQLHSKSVRRGATASAAVLPPPVLPLRLPLRPRRAPFSLATSSATLSPSSTPNGSKSSPSPPSANPSKLSHPKTKPSRSLKTPG